MTDDDWTAAAMSDGALVAELLVNLKKEPRFAPQLRWRVRQRRSKPTASPTTPLSWSGATSASGGGAEVSTSAAAERSKGVDVSENMTSKRSRKKKTLAELKEDEVLGLKERSDLKKKLASLHVTVEIERARNDRLKRLKIDCVSRFAKRVSSPVPAEESSKMVPSISPFSADLRINSSNSMERLGLSDPAKPNEEAAYQEINFMLPDLNLPIEDHNT